MLKIKRGKLLVFGLTPSELEHLKTGHPLQIKLDDIGLQGAGCIIFVGDTNEKMKAQFEGSGISDAPRIDLSAAASLLAKKH
jgi:hypothetical protein